MPTPSRLLLALLTCLPACHTDESTDEQGADPAVGQVQQVSYEVLPTPLYELGILDFTLDNATYAQREAFTVEVRDAILPDIVAAVGLGDQMLDTELTPGGFQLITNPSLQTRLMASDAQVERFAAAIGYVFSQWSVLVTDFTDTAGGTGFGVVSFASKAVEAQLGQQFFEHAASVAEGLGGGYFAFATEVIFLNLRSPAGDPYSGLEDDEFIAALEMAADTFAPYRAELVQSGEAAVIFVENDWNTAKVGEDYLDILDPIEDAIGATLVDLKTEHIDRFEAAAAAHKWN